jgi:hypothetical protein
LDVREFGNRKEQEISMSDWKRRALVVCLGVICLCPGIGWAQELGTVAGVVKDSSDAVLPGVTVEVSSPALIEKVRSATTDGAGQYRIINLPPGVYRVSFALAGFSTTVRENIEVRVNFTTPINASMSLGQQQETITVTGESPIVDVQTVTQSRAITAEQNKELPSGGGVFNLAVLVPGVTANFTDVGGSAAESATTRVSVRGGSNGDTVPLLDGLKVGNLFVGAGQVNIMPINPLLGEQVDVQTAGQSAEAASLGVLTNVIPKSGGNTFSGTAYVIGGRGDWQSDNLTPRVQALGLTQVNKNRGTSDINSAFGGPVLRDRLWFYSIARYNKYSNFIAGQYFTKDISATRRELDQTRQAYNETNNKEGAIRVAGALSQAQRVTGLLYYQKRVYPYQNISSVTAPEAATNYDFPGWFWSGSYTNVLTNRLLIDGAMLYSYSPFRWTPDAEIMRRSAGLTAQQIIAGVNGAVVPIQEQGGTLGPPWNYRSSTILQYKGDTLLTRLPYRASLNYTTGSHNLKVGFDNSRGVRRNDTSYDPIGNISYRTRDYVPNQITLYAPPATNTQILELDLGLFAQERWTLKRATVTAGLRADFLRAGTDGFTNGPSPWIPGRGTRPTDTYQGRENVPNWKDLNPRLGVAYDLFGNGKTALKGSFVRGVQVEALGTAIANDPATTVASSTARTWTDVNGNFIPDCDLTNAQAQGPATGAIDVCGANQNLAFGSSVPATASNPDLLNGWHKRPWIWEFSGGVQHEIMPRMSASVTYFRRVEGNFTLTDNLATTAGDYRQYSVTVPTDPRIPDSGGTISGLSDVRPELLGVTRNYITFASDYGNMYRHYTGVDVTLDVRPRPSLYLQGGMSTGNTMRDSCDVLDKVPEAAFALGGGTGGGGTQNDGLVDRPFCHQETGYRAQYKFLGAYTLPWDLRVSGTLQSMPGVQIQANVIYTGAQILAMNPSLGSFSTGANGQASVGVITPGTLFNDRTNQVDFRLAKILRLGGTNTVDLAFDLYNLFNSDAIQGQNNTYSGVNGGAWLRPTALINPRFLKLSARWDF